MGSNIIQGEVAGSGGKTTSHSGMGNLQQKSGQENIMATPSMFKRENNFMVGSGTQLNSAAVGASGDKPLNLFNNKSESKRNLNCSVSL